MSVRGMGLSDEWDGVSVDGVEVVAYMCIK